MLPFHQTVWSWRLHRGLTQATLASHAGITRPNLSAIEQGRREVSLKTLRALAGALGVRPGLLVDGIPPESPSGEPAPVSRATLERLADAVALHRPARPDERPAVDALRALLGPRLLAARGQPARSRMSRRTVLAAWVKLTGLYGRPAIQTLADRVRERQAAAGA
jgi:transcriptional regulator with XRE-family HTH domain